MTALFMLSYGYCVMFGLVVLCIFQGLHHRLSVPISSILELFVIAAVLGALLAFAPVRRQKRPDSESQG